MAVIQKIGKESLQGGNKLSDGSKKRQQADLLLEIHELKQSLSSWKNRLQGFKSRIEQVLKYVGRLEAGYDVQRDSQRRLLRREIVFKEALESIPTPEQFQELENWHREMEITAERIFKKKRELGLDVAIPPIRGDTE